MAYVFFNPNPHKKLVGDCVIRAISKLTEQAWDDVYLGVVLQGYSLSDMPSSNYVWESYLKDNGYDGGMSNAYSRDYSMNSYDGRRGRDGDSDGRYSEDYRGYSRHDEKETMMQKM